MRESGYSPAESCKRVGNRSETNFPVRVPRPAMDIGIAFDLKTDFEPAPTGGPEDALEEYDSPATIAGIERALVAMGHSVRKLGGGRRFVIEVLEAPPELVFNIAEGRGSRS